MPETIKNLFSHSINELSKISSTPQLDAEVLLSFATGKSREFILAHPEYNLTRTQEIKLKQLLKRRLKYEPIAYLIGQKEFFGLNFKVNKHTLIPRPETEHLVDAVFINLQLVNSKKTMIVDIGTGSGNIIISIAKNLSSFCHSRENGNPVANHSVSTLDSRMRGNDKYIFFATDISKKALQVAKVNAKKHKVDKKIKFINSNLLKYFIDHCSLNIDHCIIVSNLPYLSQKIYSKVSKDVKNFEPKSALYAKKRGLYYYEQLFKQFEKILLIIDHWSLIIEISPEQKLSISKLVKKYFLNYSIEFKKDLAGKWRVVIIKI